MKNSVQKAKKAGKPSHSNGQDAAHGAPRLTFTIGETKEKVTPARLAKDEFADALRQRCDTATSAACDLKHLLALPDAERWSALDFLAGLKNCTFTVTGNSHDHLFDAVLALPVTPEKTETMRNWKLAALEAAVLCYPDALDIACNRVRERMRAMKVTGVKNASLLAEAREILTQLQRAGHSASTKPTTVLMAVPDAPVSNEVVVPSGWLLTDRAVERSGEPAPSISAPVVIAERGADAQRGTELLTLAWKRNDRWSKRIVNRREVADQRAILVLAESGLPVNSINARTLVQYLDEFESANLDALTCVRVSGRMGWQGDDGKDGFLWGHNLVTADGIHFDGKTEQSAPLIRFRGLDSGEEQLAGGFRQGGTFKGWLKAVKPLADHPRALTGLYGAFVPPMLQILGAFNFMIDFAGSTSEGKTTALRVAASVWGNPIEGSGDSVLQTWNGTPTWRERVASLCGDMPLILDDTKNVRFPEEVAKTIYSVVQGRGRGRGTPQGIAQQGHCVTVLFSSGEQSAIGFTRDGGTRPRVLSFWGSPFGATNLEAGQLARKLTRRLQTHFGHAGPRFVQYLLERREDWDEWRQWYGQLVRYYEEQAGDDAVAGRMAAHFAAIHVASSLAHEALDLPWEWTDPIEPVREELVGNSGDADVAAQAFQLVYNWAVAHRKDFYHPKKPLGDQPPGGWVGRWDEDREVITDDGPQKWAWIGILPEALRRVLAEGGFDEHASLRAWKERGWLMTDDDGRNTKKVKIGDNLPRVVAIRRTAVEEMA